MAERPIILAMANPDPEIMLDASVTRIGKGVRIAAVWGLAATVCDPHADRILPDPFDRSVVPRVAEAVREAALQKDSCARARSGRLRARFAFFVRPMGPYRRIAMTQTHTAAPDPPARRFFWALTARPVTVIVAFCLVTLGAACVVPRLSKDSRVELFIPPDHPVMKLSKRIEREFGIHRSLVVLLVSDGAHGIFTPPALALIDPITRRMRRVPGVNPDRVSSLATVRLVKAADDELDVHRLLSPLPSTQQEADHLRSQVLEHAEWVGSLVGRAGTGTTVSVELSSDADQDAAYRAALDIVRDYHVTGPDLYVTGTVAFTATLGEYLEADTNRLIVLVGAVVASVIFVAFRTLRALVLPQLAVGFTLLITGAGMVLAGSKINLISNALPVLLTALAVADSIHLLTQYYEEAERDPTATGRQLAVRTATTLWRPCVGTSITDSAGFLAIYGASTMPAMSSFALFGALGTLASLVVNLGSLPVLFACMPSRRCAAISRAMSGDSAAGTVRYGERAGLWILRHANLVLFAFVLSLVAGAMGASRVVLDDALAAYFQPTDPVIRAHEAIRAQHIGSDLLDILVQGQAPDSILEPNVLAAMAGLQTDLDMLPQVTGSLSVADVLGSFQTRAPANRRVTPPQSSELAAQFLLLADSPELGALINRDRNAADIRIFMDAHWWRQQQVVLQTISRKTERRAREATAITMSLAGPTMVLYQWVKQVGRFNIVSTIVALVVVWMMLVATFRSIAAGSMTLIPMSAAIVLIYGFMGYTGIRLGVATSMFASITVGVGVNFAIHTVAKLTALCRDQELPLERAVPELIRSTGRALCVISAALVVGFSVIMTSLIPTLARFGLLLTLAIVVSTVVSLGVVPALAGRLRPGSICGPKSAT